MVAFRTYYIFIKTKLVGPSQRGKGKGESQFACITPQTKALKWTSPVPQTTVWGALLSFGMTGLGPLRGIHGLG